jgi:hypothetical protein
MSEVQAVSSEVDVAVDPTTAFVAFTEEMDLWWRRGPINFYDSGRAVARRCEPGVGGRLLEVYDEATGDALELGRITVWEPGVRLAWQSALDDVAVEVSFEPAAAGPTTSDASGWPSTTPVRPPPPAGCATPSASSWSDRSRTTTKPASGSSSTWPTAR